MRQAGNDADRPAMPGPWLFGRLSLMMLLEFAAYASWYPTLGLVLRGAGLSGAIGTAHALGAVAALISPPLIGAIGDRLLSAQKLLGIAHLAGGGLMLLVHHAVAAHSRDAALGLIFAYMLCFVPTLDTVNAIALRHLRADRRRFPYVRLFGTLGWMLAGLGVGAAGLSPSIAVFAVSATTSIVLGLYAFTLPATPPAAAGGSRFSPADLMGAKALVLLKQRNFATLMGCALLNSISTGVYNAYASPFLGALGFGHVASLMALGQVSELLFIASIPFVLARVGVKWAVMTGICTWALRFGLFAAAAHGQPALALASIGLHGVCSDFFVVISAMYIDRIAPPALRAQAQGWLILVISGFGTAIGAGASGLVYAHTVARAGSLAPAAWAPLWLAPIAATALTGLLWAALFRSSPRELISDRATDPRQEQLSA